ncbi:hypothetical protein V6N13_128391 [Hibiscus sabdariffa]
MYLILKGTAIASTKGNISGKSHISQASSVPTTTVQENINNGYSYQPEYAQTKSFKKAPHEFFGGSEPAVSASMSTPNFFLSNPNPSGSNNANFVGVLQNHHPHSMKPNNLPLRPAFPQDNLLSPNSQNHGFRPISSDGQSAMMASQCRYVEEFALADVLQILNMIIAMKKWIVHHQSGWQAITVTLPAN